MVDREALFLRLLSDAIHKGELSPENRTGLTPETAAPVLELARLHHVLPLVGALVLEAVPEMTGLRRQIHGTVVRQLQINGTLLRLCEGLRQAGIPSLVVKGAALRRLYPVPELRPSSDEDLLVTPADMARAHEILVTLGCQAQTDQPDQDVRMYQLDGLHVELHQRLLPEEWIQKLNLDRRFSACCSQGMAFSVDEGMLYTLSPEDGLLYLILHAYKHFLAGGVGIRQLCDLLLYTREFGAQMDADALWEDLRQGKLQVFFRNLLDIGYRYLGFGEALLPIPGDLTGADSEALLADILQAGVFGDSTMERRHSGSITIQAVRTGKKRSVLTALFPPAQMLQGRYPYLQRHRWMLPAAWCSRGVAYLRREPNALTGGVDSARIGKQRMALLEKYEML